MAVIGAAAAADDEPRQQLTVCDMHWFFAHLFRRKVMLTLAQYRKRFRMMRQVLGGER